jgi:hypothetical protein
MANTLTLCLALSRASVSVHRTGGVFDLEVLSRTDDGRLELAPTLTAPLTTHFHAMSSADIESEMAARLYVATRLGRNINAALATTTGGF